MKCPSITLQSYSTCRLASNHNLRSRVSPFVYFFSQQASNLSPHPLSNAYPSPRRNVDLLPGTHYTPQISDFNYDNVEWTPRYDWRLRAPAARRRKQEPPTNPGTHTQQRKYIKRIIPPQMDVQIVEPCYEQIQLYKKHFFPLLNAERREEEATFRERLANWPLDRLKQEGYCITGLSAFWFDFPHMGRPVASFLLGPGITLPPHNFDNGVQVLVSRVDPLTEVPFKGSVLSHSSVQLRVAFQERFELDDGSWRLDLGCSDIIYQRMCTAISHLNHDPAAQERYVSTPDRQLVLQGTHLRDVLLHSFTPSSKHSHSLPLQSPDDVSYVSHETLEHGGKLNGDTSGAFKDDMRIQSWARRYMRPNPVRVEGDPVLQGLNATQIRAAATMIGERLSLIQGPPGTGKTKTIIETLKLLKTHFEVVHPIMVCTYTNVAVDNLVEGFVSAGLKPLRIGYGKVKPSLLEYTLDNQIAQHPLKPKMDKVTRDLQDVRKRLRVLEADIAVIKSSKQPAQLKRLEFMQSDFSTLTKLSQRLSAKEYGIYQEMLKDVVTLADVVCTTCISSAVASLNIIDFPVVFLDEASMSTEPASLIPIMKGSQHLALIGDHKQLPPVITSHEAKTKGLGISLFERLTEEGMVPSVMLDVQYRMHPDISSFPSAEFYNFCLQDGTVEDNGNVSLSLTPPNSSHLEINAATGNRPSVIFLDHAGSESKKDRSRVNWNEAHIVCSVVEDLLLHNEHLRGADIGIIAPYAAQISLLTRFFNTDPTYRKRFEHVLGEQRAMQLKNIEIKTVDGFEGREKEIIVFSTVRNNPHGNIGFLADRRRLNVGLTRAKRGLFVVGSISTLKAAKVGRGRAGDSFVEVGKGAESWRRYAECLSERGLILQLSGDRLRKALYGNSMDAGRIVNH